MCNSKMGEGLSECNEKPAYKPGRYLTDIQVFSTIQKVIYTTSAIESFNSGYRHLNKQKCVFPSDIVLPKALYLAIMEISQHRFGTGAKCSVSLK